MPEIMKGTRDLVSTLNRIDVVTAAGLDAIVRESLAPIREQTSLNYRRNRRRTKKVPRGGHLDQGVVIRKVAGRGKVMREFWVTLTRRARSIGHLVELGTAPHFQPHRKVLHPGARPYPGMAPAFESRKEETVTTLAQKTWGLIVTAALSGRTK